MHWIVPDVVAFFGSIAVIILIRKASTDRKFEQELKTVLIKGSESSEEHQRLDLMTKRRYKKLKTFGILSTAASLCMSGIVHPSILNGIYFLSFLGSSTWLSCNRTLGTKYAVLLRILSVLLMLHITGIILYQLPFFQSIIKDDSFLLRIILGLKKIFSSKSQPSNQLHFNMNLNADVYLNPFILMTTYCVVSTTSNFILVRTKKFKITDPTSNS